MFYLQSTESVVVFSVVRIIENATVISFQSKPASATVKVRAGLDWEVLRSEESWLPLPLQAGDGSEKLLKSGIKLRSGLGVRGGGKAVAVAAI